MSQVFLVVRQDKLAQTIAGACQDRGAAAERLPDAESALEKMAADNGGEASGALILDLSELGTKSDKKINQFLAELPAGVRVVGLGSGYEIKSVTSFFRSGLFDYLNLPLDPIELTRALNKCVGSLATPEGRAQAAAARPAKTSGPAASPANSARPSQKGTGPAAASDPPDRAAGAIVGRDPGLKEVFRIVEKVAATDSTVMVHGESGTGKELVARAIHRASPRRDRPMIPVNCGAIPEELLETELFGHEKGAFTNAIRDRIGRFEMADGGTIFLDEIGDMSAKLQVKLLRVIQEHEFERVGGDRTISVDIRVITATHVDLTRAVEDGRFREDLYYRLNVIPLTIPPLRDRAGDVPLLVEHFLARLRETRGSKVTGLTPETLAMMRAYHWPGNVRELENLMERMVILADAPILTPDDLPQRLRQEAESKIGAAAKSVPGAPNVPGATETRAAAADAAGSDHDEKPLWPDFSKLGSEDNFPDLPEDAAADEPPGGLTAAQEQWAAEAGDAADAGASDLGPELRALLAPIIEFPASGVDLNGLMGRFEDLLIKSALKANGQVKNVTAKALGLNRTTFLEKLKKRGL
jgi:DNA-binding NtrC family response regulator